MNPTTKNLGSTAVGNQPQPQPQANPPGRPRRTLIVQQPAPPPMEPPTTTLLAETLDGRGRTLIAATTVGSTSTNAMGGAQGGPQQHAHAGAHQPQQQHDGGRTHGKRTIVVPSSSSSGVQPFDPHRQATAVPVVSTTNGSSAAAAAAVVHGQHRLAGAPQQLPPPPPAATSRNSNNNSPSRTASSIHVFESLERKGREHISQCEEEARILVRALRQQWVVLRQQQDQRSNTAAAAVAQEQQRQSKRATRAGRPASKLFAVTGFDRVRQQASLVGVDESAVGVVATASDVSQPQRKRGRTGQQLWRGQQGRLDDLTVVSLKNKRIRINRSAEKVKENLRLWLSRFTAAGSTGAQQNSETKNNNAGGSNGGSDAQLYSSSSAQTLLLPEKQRELLENHVRLMTAFIEELRCCTPQAFSTFVEQLWRHPDKIISEEDEECEEEDNHDGNDKNKKKNGFDGAETFVDSVFVPLVDSSPYEALGDISAALDYANRQYYAVVLKRLLRTPLPSAEGQVGDEDGDGGKDCPGAAAGVAASMNGRSANQDGATTTSSSIPFLTVSSSLAALLGPSVLSDAMQKVKNLNDVDALELVRTVTAICHHKQPNDHSLWSEPLLVAMLKGTEHCVVARRIQQESYLADPFHPAVILGTTSSTPNLGAKGTNLLHQRQDPITESLSLSLGTGTPPPGRPLESATSPSFTRDTPPGGSGKGNTGTVISLSAECLCQAMSYVRYLLSSYTSWRNMIIGGIDQTGYVDRLLYLCLHCMLSAYALGETLLAASSLAVVFDVLASFQRGGKFPSVASSFELAATALEPDTKAKRDLDAALGKFGVPLLECRDLFMYYAR